MIKYSNKYKNKNHLIKIKKKLSSSTLHFGNVGMIALNAKYLNSNELDSCRKNILKRIKSKGELIVKVNPFLGITSKPLATRMGKGKGMIDTWSLPVKHGMVLFEVRCPVQNLTQIKWALKLASNSLSINIKIIENIY